MQKYVVEWVSANPEVTGKRFVESGFGLTHNKIKVLESLHVVGIPKGFLVIETDAPHLVHEALVSWHGTGLQTNIYPCVGDDEAKAALKF